MKKGFLILLLLCSVFTQAQSLKEALFSGKLKSEPGKVVRKGDDLTPKVDTTAKIVMTDSVKADSALMTAVAGDSSAVVNSTVKAETIPTDTAVTTALADTPAAEKTAEAPRTNSDITKENNRVWKGYMDTLAGVLKAEVLPSKKIKKESYYVLISYAIGTDGKVTVGNVSVTPENEFLQQQIKDRVELEAPRLTPLMSSNGSPRKSNSKYNFTLVKE